MGDEEEVGKAEAAEEKLDPEPDTETVGEEDVEDAEPEAEPPWKRTRDDLYRRQSRVEGSVDQINRSVEELKNLMLRQGASLGGTQGSGGSSTTLDPMQARIRMNQDPVGFMKSLVREELQQTETRVTSTMEERQAETNAQQTLQREYPEIFDETHPFWREADQVYRELTNVRGFPRNQRTILTAAELAAAKHPDLREQSLKERRRAGGREATRTSIPDGLKVERGVTKPKPKEDGLPPLDENVARSFFGDREWEKKKKDPKAMERMRRDQAELNQRRLPTRSELATKGEEE